TQSYSATPRVGQGRRCRRGPRTHVWGRHVDCVGRLRVQVPRPTDDAQVKRRTRQAPQNGSSLVRPLAPTNRTVGWVGSRALVESPWLFLSAEPGDSTRAPESDKANKCTAPD